VKNWLSQQIAFALGTNSGKKKGNDNPDGLFGAGNRTFGQAEYANTIVGIVQNVAGVKWAIVRVFNVLAPADDPATISIDSSSAVFNESVAPGNGQILSLFSAHLTLTAVAEPVKGAC
jgi:hypothetical protein